MPTRIPFDISNYPSVDILEKQHSSVSIKLFVGYKVLENCDKNILDAQVFSVEKFRI